MRPLEFLILLAVLLSLLAHLVPRSKRQRWFFLLPLLVASLVVLHLLLEGYRWQMVLAYVLAFTLLLAGLLPLVRRQQFAAKPRRNSRSLMILGTLVGLVVVWVSVELCVQVPVFNMPEPGGPYAVGTRTFLLVDDSRPDDASPIANGFRSMSVQAWYPAELAGNEERTTYIRADIRKEMEALDGPPAWYSGHLDHVRTYAHWDASMAEADAPFPVILYSPSGNASLHKILFEELASQGYVVVSISHPHWSNVLFDDQGDVIPQGGVSERYQTWFREENSSAVQTAKGRILAEDSIERLEQAQIDLNMARPVAIAELRQWAADDGFVLDRLAEMSQPGGFFAGRLDLSQVGVMGFSLGGATAGQFCVTDTRCRAGINVDGFMFGDILDNNLNVPFMFLHSSYPKAKPVGALFYEWAEHSAYMLQIAGSTHHDLGAPAPTGQPIVLELGIDPGQFPDGAYLARIMNDYILSFFDEHLKNEPAPLFDGPSPYPEVLFGMRERPPSSMMTR